MKDEKQVLGAIHGQGAEDYIAGYIMLNLNYLAHRSARTFPGYNLIIQHPETGKSCKVQVQHRGGHSGKRGLVRVRNPNFDFLVLTGEPEGLQVDFSRSRTADSGIHMTLSCLPAWVITREEFDLGAVQKAPREYKINGPRTEENLYAFHKIVDFLGPVKIT